MCRRLSRNPGRPLQSNDELACQQVAFGSAPGVPNWGRLLQRASDGMANDDERFFDTLFAVDPARGWYQGAQ
jgi:hypothetical protein